MWELDCEESWSPKNWCFWTVVLEKTLESPLDYKEIQPVHSEGDQPWVFFGRTDAKAETPSLWPPHVKRWLIGKDCDSGRDWGPEEKRTIEDEKAGWHHQLIGREFEWTPEDGVGQGGLACCHSWSCKESDTELNWTLLVHKSQSYERLHSTWSFRKEWKLVKWSSTCFRFYNHLFKLIFSFMYFSLKNSVSECPVTDSLPYLLHSTLYYYFHSLYTLYANRSNMKIDCYWVNFIEYKLVSS